MILTEIRRKVRKCTLCERMQARHCEACTRCPGQPHRSGCPEGAKEMPTPEIVDMVADILNQLAPLGVVADRATCNEILESAGRAQILGLASADHIGVIAMTYAIPGGVVWPPGPAVELAEVGLLIAGEPATGPEGARLYHAPRGRS